MRFTGLSVTGCCVFLCRSLGTPEEASWPGVSGLPDFKPNFPHWPARKDAYSRICPTLDAAGLDLLSKMLVYAPGRRISAKDAMRCVEVAAEPLCRWALALSLLLCR